MHKLVRQVFTALLVASCGGDTAPPVISGTVDGFVVVTGPVQGAKVTAFAFDPATGERGEELAVSEPSDEDGAFHLDLVDADGPVLFVASGAGATYVEPASGIDVVWDSRTELLAVYVAKDGSGALSFERDRGLDTTGFVISPWSTLGVAYADGSSRPYLEALETVHEKLETHLGVDFWAVTPTGLTDGPVGAWNENVQFGAELAGWSQFALRLAEESFLTPAAITSLDLLEQLRRDITDGRFDGKTVSSSQIVPLVLGTCDACTAPQGECPCNLGRCTLRGLYAEGINEFVNGEHNESGVRATDVSALTARITQVCSEVCEDDDIWEKGSCLGDTQPPTVTIEGIGPGDITGSVPVTIRLEDSRRLSEELISVPNPVPGQPPILTDIPAKIEFVRGSDPAGAAIDDGEYHSKYKWEKVDPLHHTITFTLHSDELPDAPYLLRVTAYDAAYYESSEGQKSEHTTTATAPFIANNSDLGTVSGLVAVSGRVSGARVSIYEFDEEIKGDLLGSAVTNAEGAYTIVLQPTLQSTLLIEVDNVPGEDPATYVELSTNTTITFGSADKLSSVLTLWEDGKVRDDGMVTPYTTMGRAFAHALYAYYPPDPNLPPAGQYAAKVASAFSILEEHFNDGNILIRFRSSAPFNFATWDPDQDLSLTDGVRYSLILAGLSEQAADHAAKSGSSPATMNTLTLATKLAIDLGANYSETESLKPLWDGKSPSGPVTHGLVVIDSYTTRLSLAVFVAAYVNREQLFGPTEIAPLLDQMSKDMRLELYPEGEPGTPFDTVPPDVKWDETVVPANMTVLRGIVNLKAIATDNVALQSGTFVFTGEGAPQVSEAMVFVGDSGPEGPWVLTGKLNTEAFVGDGPHSITVSVKDKVNEMMPATKTRTFIVDRILPTASVDQAVLPSGATLAPGEITGAASITLKGKANDTNFLSASYTVNGGAPVALTTPAAGGAWSATVNLVHGDNKVIVTAKDKAGNVGTSSTVNYRRDAMPPSANLQANIQTWKDDKATIGASTTPGGMSVTYAMAAGGGLTPFVDGVSLTRFASNMGPSDGGVPVATFNVQDDNDSSGTTVNLKIRLRRGSSTLVDWKDISVATGNSRSEILNSDLHKDLALYSDTFVLDYRATDVYGNVSAVQSVSWKLTLKAPPVRQRVGASCSGVGCPSTYSFASNNAHLPINSSVALMRLGGVFIDNPTDVPVRVKFSGTAPSTYSVGAKFDAAIVTGLPTITGPACDGGLGETFVPAGGCYNPPAPVEQTQLNKSAGNLLVDFEVIGSKVTPIIIFGDAPVEWELGPNSTATVYARAKGLGFLWSWLNTGVSGPNSFSIGSISNKTGRMVQRYRWCEDPFTPPNGDEPTFCQGYQDSHTVQYLTRVKVTPVVTVSVESKPADLPIVFQPAQGENVSNFGYTNYPWSSAESPATPF